MAIDMNSFLLGGIAGVIFAGINFAIVSYVLSFDIKNNKQ